MRKFSKAKVMDRLHHAFVYGCMALTAAGLFDLGWVGYQYYVYIKPARQAEQLRLQQELLQEGAVSNTPTITS
uniref:Uncharacterized protein n=1 Tax=Bracon brevicornis TaxID=1563983 RepID=A0A6V7I765_9HYME